MGQLTTLTSGDDRSEEDGVAVDSFGFFSKPFNERAGVGDFTFGLEERFTVFCCHQLRQGHPNLPVSGDLHFQNRSAPSCRAVCLHVDQGAAFAAPSRAEGGFLQDRMKHVRAGSQTNVALLLGKHAPAPELAK